MDVCKQKHCSLIADQIRCKALEIIRKANSGHIGGSFSIAEILSVLYFDAMNIDPAEPRKADRDRLVLSKGHCSPALYTTLAMRGFFPVEDLDGFRSMNSYLSGHVEMTKVPGVDMSTGSLGQGLSVAAGMALCAKTYGDSYYTYAILGDGEIQEGQIWEAVMAASKYKLDNLVAFIDKNGLQLDGTTAEILDMSPLKEKFESFGWAVIEIDGHDVQQISEAIEAAKAIVGKPIAVIANTVKGKGVSVFEGQLRFHGGRPTAEEYDIAFAELKARIAEKEGSVCPK